MSGLRRWRFELPGQRRDHRRHELITTCHRRDWRGRPRLAAELCLTCRVIVREWRLCGRPTRTGRPCKQPAIVVRAAPWPCDRHHATRRAS